MRYVVIPKGSVKSFLKFAGKVTKFLRKTNNLEAKISLLVPNC